MLSLYASTRTTVTVVDLVLSFFAFAHTTSILMDSGDGSSNSDIILSHYGLDHRQNYFPFLATQDVSDVLRQLATHIWATKTRREVGTQSAGLGLQI